jgi:hypothetical protein
LITLAWTDTSRDRAPRLERVGDPAGLVLVDVDPSELTAMELREMPVHATLVAGRWMHRAA